MSAPEPDEPQHPAPERKDPVAEAEEKPAEPCEKPSHTKARTTASTSGSGGQKRRGRPPKAKAEPAAPAEGAFVQPVAEFLQALTIVGATAPVPPGDLRTKVRLQAALVNQHVGGIATAVDAAARNNAVIRRGVEALTMGSAGWVLPAVLAVAPFAAQSAGLWRSPVAEGMAEQADGFAEAVKAQLQGAGQADARPAA